MFITRLCLDFGEVWALGDPKGVYFGFTGWGGVLWSREALHLDSINGTIRWFQINSEINYPAEVLGHEFWKYSDV